MARAFATNWLVDLKVNAGVIFGAYNLKKRAYRASGLALAANNVTHVRWIHIQGNEYAALVDYPSGLNVRRVVDNRPNDIFDELLIGFHSIQKHSCFTEQSVDRCGLGIRQATSTAVRDIE